MTAKNGSLDPLGKFFAVSSTDGNIHIFNIPSEGDDSNIGQLIKKIKVTKLKLEAFG